MCQDAGCFVPSTPSIHCLSISEHARDELFFTVSSICATAAGVNPRS